MPVKTVLILANSVRQRPNACVAGRELIEEGGVRRFSHWVRPVSTHGQGELSLQERTTAQGHEVSVLDIVRMTVGERVPDALQPENWLHAPPRWEVIGRATRIDLMHAVEEPASLWDDQRDRSDRISAARAEQVLGAQSLHLIRVEQLLIRLYTEEYPERVRKHRRAVFTYRGRDYNLGITDPTVEGRYALRVPPLSRPMIEHRIANNCCVCISVAHKAISGFHYKLAASIIDPEKL